MNFDGKKITVAGLARSGVGAANLLVRLGADVTVTDLKSEDELSGQLMRLDPRVKKILGSHPDELFELADLIVISPGIPLSAPPFKKAADAKVPVIGELEIAYLYSDSPFIAITGTNGKSTTTTLVGEMLAASEMKVTVGGNLGNALTEEPESLIGRDYIVAEVSSFQLETIDKFSPKLSALLNVTQDHLDRYRDMDDYARAKARVYMNQTPKDYLIVNADDAPSVRLAEKAMCRIIPFSRKDAPAGGVFVRDGMAVSALSGNDEKIIETKDIRIRGVHNLENALAAAAISLAAGASLKAVEKVLREFPGLEHRLEFVRELNGVSYINDSKGTNVGAVEKSLESFTEPVVLLAGGLDKHSDFSPLKKLVRERVKRLVLFGKAADVIGEAIGGETDTVRASSLQDAVLKAKDAASKGDVVLLSPACASFDMFRDFEDRGRQFKEIVRKL
jgi:UDP-N-acetylmuramoylalanine--D-glutamate ligase